MVIITKKDDAEEIQDKKCYDRKTGNTGKCVLKEREYLMKKYDYLKLPYKDVWGLLMPRDHPLAAKEAVCPEDLEGLPLLVSRQAMVQDGLSGWLGVNRRSPEIVATYNLIFNASLLVRQGVGCALCLAHLVPEYPGSPLVFRPFAPLLDAGVSVAWKKYQVFTKPGRRFLEALQHVLSEGAWPQSQW